MSCERYEIREQLSAWLDGELTEGQARRVARAVAEDADLAAELASLQAVREMLRRLPRQPAPAGMSERVLQEARRSRQAAEGPGRERRTLAWWGVRLAAAAAVLIAIGVIAQRNDRDEPVLPAGGSGDLALREKPGHSDTETLGRDATVAEKAEDLRESKLAAVDGRAGGDALGKARFAEDRDHLAKGHDKDGKLDGGDESVLLWMNTPEPELTKVQFEHILQEKYRVEPEVVEDASAAKAVETQVIRPRGNYYNQSQVGPNRIVYEVAIPEGELASLMKDFNELRAAQHVAQVPLIPSPAKEVGAALTDELASAEARRQVQAKGGMKAAVEGPAQQRLSPSEAGQIAMANSAAQPGAPAVPAGITRKVDGPCPPATAATPPATRPQIAPAAPATRAVQPAEGMAVAQAATVPATAPAFGKAGPDVQPEQPGDDPCLGAITQTQPIAQAVQIAQARQVQRTEHGAAATQAAAAQAGSNVAFSRMTQLRVVLNGVPTGFSAADVRALDLHAAPASEPAK